MLLRINTENVSNFIVCSTQFCVMVTTMTSTSMKFSCYLKTSSNKQPTFSVLPENLICNTAYAVSGSSLVLVTATSISNNSIYVYGYTSWRPGYMRRCGRKSRGEKLSRSGRRMRFCCGENWGMTLAHLRPAFATQSPGRAGTCAGRWWW